MALLGQRAWFVFGLPGFQGGLLGQGEHFDDGGFAPVGGLELLGQLADAMVDGRASRGVFVDQFGGDADDFAHRPFARCGGLFGEPDTDFADEQGFDAGVVELRCGHGGVVQRGAVQCEPAWYAVGADRLHFVADHQVGVQVGVTGARVAVIERCGDQSGGVDLGDTVGAHAGKGRVVFEKLQRFGDGLVVAVLDGARDAGPARSPTAPTPI